MEVSRRPGLLAASLLGVRKGGGRSRDLVGRLVRGLARPIPHRAVKLDLQTGAFLGGNSSILGGPVSIGRGTTAIRLRVVAEGVETLEQLAFLQANECDEAQGFYLSEPLPPQEFAELLRTGMSVPSVAVRG